ncbi:hypothetical protein [uncultured Methanobrevibacter sp.]|uniref:hypothetical protein n=1 Tax=uncultured Methanobrevibacter sp. TaxID=253161 RepID=UPI0025CD092F|nr:hypothetical protein [uncultured Methanobrevibacter sp.]
MELPRNYKNKKAELKKPEIEEEEKSVKVFDLKMEESTDGYDSSKESKTSGTFDDLQVEIDNATAGSILHLYRDYNGNYGSRIQFHKDLTIDGHGHTLDCLYQGGCSAFYSSSGNITLKNLSIIHGHNDHTDKGGAIYITGSAQYTLINCSLIDNWADDYGGAIYNEVNKPLTLINCLLKGNTADDDSGGAVFSNGEVIIKNSILDNNRAWLDGGAVYCNKNVKVFNSSLTSNVAKGASSQCYGGAICSKEDVVIENCTISNNFAADYGGGVYAKNIYVNQGQSLLSLFAGNTADDNDCGALYAEETLKMSYADLNENKAYEDGGAVLCTNAYLDNCQFLSNHAEGSSFKQCEGGAIFAKDDVHI